MPVGPRPTIPLAPFAAAAALLLVWPSSAARADGAVMVAGKVSPHDRELIVDTVRGEGTALGLRFSSLVFSRDAAEASVACLKDKAPWSCVSPTIRGKDQILIVEVASDRGVGAPMTVVTAHLLTAGAEDESFASRDCEMCNEDALRRAVGDLCRDLLQRAAARTGRTRLGVHSKPAGAQATLDGKAVGSLDVPMATYPGRHTVVLQLPGYAPLTREVVAADGRTTHVTLELEPAVHRPGSGERGRLSQFLPGLAVGVGGSAIAAGGFLIWFDQDVDLRGRQQPHYYDTSPLGVVSLTAGVVVAGAGLYYLMRPRATPMAAVAPLPGGAAVGLAGRF